MKHLFLWVKCLFLLGYTAQAQSAALRDSLLNQLKTLPNDTNRVSALIELGFEYRHTKPDQTYLLGQQAYELSQTLNYPSGEARALNTMASAYKFLGDYAKSLKMYNQAKELNLKIRDTDRVAVILNNTADLYIQQGEWQKALATMRECYAVYQTVYKPVVSSKSVYLCNIAECYYNFNQLDSAIVYLHQALPLAKMQRESILATIYYLLGDVALAQNNANEAHRFYQQSIAVSTEENRYSDLYEGYFRMSKFFQKTAQKDSTFRYAKLALAFAQKGINAKGILKSSENLSTLFEGQNDFEAMRYFKIAVAAKDSLYSQDKMKRLVSLTFEEKERTQRTETARVNYQNKIKLAILFGTLAVFAIIALILFRNNRQKEKANVVLHGKNEEIETTLSQLKISQTQLTAKNVENELLLKEIHHRVKNNLEIVSSLLQLQMAQIDDPSVQAAMLSSQNRVHSMGIIHQKLYQGEHLATIEMRDYFINLSENILDSFNAKGQIQVECDMLPLILDIDTAVSIGLITNELLTNSLKYAFEGRDSGTIKISLKDQNTEGVLLLKIADDGIGKPQNQEAKGTGFGTQLIDLLTKQLDGQLIYEINNGTTVSLYFPKE